MSEESRDAEVSHGDLSALLRVSLALAESLDQDVAQQTAIDVAVHVLGADAGALYLVDGDELVLSAYSREPLAPAVRELRRIKIAQHTLISKAISSREPLVVTDVAGADLRAAVRLMAETRDMRALIYVPLVARGTVEGIIVVCTSAAEPRFTPADMDVARMLAGQIALAVQNVRLIDEANATATEIRTAYDATLEGWSLAFDARVQEQPGHTKHAADLACAVARELGMPDPEIPHVRRGALLHDIGEMAVPDAILKKPGPLTEEEWAVVRAHPVVAREFLERVGYLGPALDIPFYHHERWDGTGYPEGLRGTKIPLAARIFAVVDVYDALTSNRPYRKAWSAQDAAAHIVAQAGTHFDPVVVAAFAECIDTVSPHGN